MKKFFKWIAIILIIASVFSFISCKDIITPIENQQTGSIKGVAKFENATNHEGIQVTLISTDGLFAIDYYNSRGVFTNTRSVKDIKTTDKNGNYSFENIEVGTYTIYASSNSSLEKAVAINIVVSANKTVEPSVLKLTATGSIKGSITIDDKTDEVYGADILVLGTSYFASTDEKGHYEISDIPAKTGYTLCFRKNGYTYIFESNVTVSSDKATEIKKVNISSEEWKEYAFTWLGPKDDEPKNPEKNWAYYNTKDGCSYIWNAETKKWDLLAQAGKDGSEHEHNFGDWKTLKEATEFTEGLMRTSCLDCKCVFEEAIPKLEMFLSNPEPYGTRVENLNYIFNNQTLGTTTITIKRSEWNKLCDNYRYFYKNENCVVAEKYEYEKDGQTWAIANVGFRQRGNTSRFCPQGYDNGRLQGQMNADWSDDYYNYAEQPNDDYRQVHFKVDFEEYLEGDDELKMAGCMKGVALKRLDHSWGREIFCYDLFHRYGIWTAPRASHTRVLLKFIEDETDNSITEIDYGVYEMFEEVNKQSLKGRAQGEGTEAENAWANNKGNLWKCQNDLTTGRMYETGVENIVINFDEEGNRVNWVKDGYSLDLKTNKDDLASAETELRGFITDLNNLPTDGSEQSIATIKAFYEKWFDMDFFLKTYAISILCGMDDDYWGNANNFYLYFDTGKKGTGKVYFIPFDYDNVLGCSIKEGGFKQNPLEWGRGENRPLMDRMLLVPEYKQKFTELLLEVSAEDSEWTYERASQQFLDWKNMLEPYANSPDLDWHIGSNYWYDNTWKPSEYSLTYEYNNIFDATRDAIVRNLNGENVNGSLTVSEVECYDGIKVSISNIPESAQNYQVFVNGKRVFQGNEKDEEFFYPFVSEDKEYSLYIDYYDAYWNWVKKSTPITITAKGGVGEIELEEDITYYLENNALIFSSMPQLSLNSELIEPSCLLIEFQTEDWDFLGEYDINTPSFDLPEDVLSEKDKTIVFYYYAVVYYGEVPYSYTIYYYDDGKFQIQ